MQRLTKQLHVYLLSGIIFRFLPYRFFLSSITQRQLLSDTHRNYGYSIFTYLYVMVLYLLMYNLICRIQDETHLTEKLNNTKNLGVLSLRINGMSYVWDNFTEILAINAFWFHSWFGFLFFSFFDWSAIYECNVGEFRTLHITTLISLMRICFLYCTFDNLKIVELECLINHKM